MDANDYCDACGSFRLVFRLMDGWAVRICKRCGNTQHAWKEIYT